MLGKLFGRVRFPGFDSELRTVISREPTNYSPVHPRSYSSIIILNTHAARKKIYFQNGYEASYLREIIVCRKSIAAHSNQLCEKKRESWSFRKVHGHDRFLSLKLRNA